MSIEVTNQHQEVIINLQSSLTNKTDLVLKVYKNNSNSNPTLFTPTLNEDGTLMFRVPFSSFEVNDVLTKFLMTLSGTTNLYDLNEGVTILLDGKEASTITTNTYKNTFKDKKIHTLQAVYKGNNEIGVAISNKLTVKARMPENIDGDYLLETIRVPANQKYMEDILWKWKLTKGGIPVEGATIETYHFVEAGTLTTDSNGIAMLHSDNFSQATMINYQSWNVGLHQVGARFYHYDDPNSDRTVVVETWKNVRVTKNDPQIEFYKAEYVGKNAYFRLTDPQGLPLKDTKLIIKVNGKTYTKKTADSGRVKITMNRKGHFKYIVTFVGNDNLNSKTVSFEETITEGG